MTHYIGALDQGTSSTRFAIFDRAGRPIAIDQRAHRQVYPRPGWVEHDPVEILERSDDVIRGALAWAGITAADLVAVGITNQRETTVVWDRQTGEPLFERVRQSGASQAACDSETCRWQIEKATGTSLRHPVEILAEAYAAGDREATRADPQGAAAVSRSTRR